MTTMSVVYPCLSSSSDDHPLLHSCLGTGMPVGSQNKFCHFRVSLVHSASVIVFTSLSLCRWSSITILLLLVHISQIFETVTIPVLVALANTLQSHDTVDYVQDSETEDPQLVAEPRVGRNHGHTMVKELVRRQQWDRGLDRIHLQVSQRQH